MYALTYRRLASAPGAQHATERRNSRRRRRNKLEKIEVRLSRAVVVTV